MESLGYGTHVTLDAFEAATVQSQADGQVTDLLRSLVNHLESEDTGQLTVDLAAADGVSAALLQGESQLFIHLFPADRRVSLRLFTRRDVPVSPLLLAFRQRWNTSRFESHISSISKVVEFNEAAMRTMLEGDRSYARARFAYLHRGS